MTKSNAPQTSRRGDWIQTYIGGQFWPLDSRPDDINLYDIAYPLSRMCRYAGHSRCFYSVGQHSIWVMRRIAEQDLGPGAELAALLHDSAEAYILDVPRPIKHLPEMAPYRDAEKAILASVYEHFQITDVAAEHHALIKAADRVALATELRDLLGDPPVRWKAIDGVEPHRDKIHPIMPMGAIAEDFMFHAERLLDLLKPTFPGKAR